MLREGFFSFRERNRKNVLYCEYTYDLERRRRALKAILIGVLSAFFFALTFVLNRSMDLAGGSWVWSASLRYLFMVPLLLALVLMRGNLRPLLQEMRAKPWPWLLWSFVGFVLFYAPISYAASTGPSWLIAGTWQITIISGSLLVPLFYDVIETSQGTPKVRKKIPLPGLGLSLLIHGAGP